MAAVQPTSGTPIKPTDLVTLTGLLNHTTEGDHFIQLHDSVRFGDRSLESKFVYLPRNTALALFPEGRQITLQGNLGSRPGVTPRGDTTLLFSRYSTPLEFRDPALSTTMKKEGATWMYHGEGVDIPVTNITGTGPFQNCIPKPTIKAALIRESPDSPEYLKADLATPFGAAAENPIMTIRTHAKLREFWKCMGKLVSLQIDKDIPYLREVGRNPIKGMGRAFLQVMGIFMVGVYGVFRSIPGLKPNEQKADGSYKFDGRDIFNGIFTIFIGGPLGVFFGAAAAIGALLGTGFTGGHDES